MFFYGGVESPTLDQRVIDYSEKAFEKIPIIELPYEETPNARYHVLKDIVREFLH